MVDTDVKDSPLEFQALTDGELRRFRMNLDVHGCIVSTCGHVGGGAAVW